MERRAPERANGCDLMQDVQAGLHVIGADEGRHGDTVHAHVPSVCNVLEHFGRLEDHGPLLLCCDV